MGSSSGNPQHMLGNTVGVRSAGQSQDFLGGAIGSNPQPSNNPQDEPFSEDSSHLSSQPGGMLQGAGAQAMGGGLLNPSSNQVQGSGFQGAGSSDMTSNDLSSGFNFGGSSGGMFGGENPFQTSFKKSMML